MEALLQSDWVFKLGCVTFIYFKEWSYWGIATAKAEVISDNLTHLREVFMQTSSYTVHAFICLYGQFIVQVLVSCNWKGVYECEQLHFDILKLICPLELACSSLWWILLVLVAVKADRGSLPFNKILQAVYNSRYFQNKQKKTTSYKGFYRPWWCYTAIPSSACRYLRTGCWILPHNLRNLFSEARYKAFQMYLLSNRWRIINISAHVLVHSYMVLSCPSIWWINFYSL